MNTTLPRERAGRWVRHGDHILLLPARGPSALEGEVPRGATGTPSAAAYTVCDFIHPRIDVEAQHALHGLLSRGPAARAAALSMLGAIRLGDVRPNDPNVLWGIFQENQQVPAMRTRSSGGWWTLIPKGVNAVCGVGRPPIIAFRRSVAKDPFALGTALLSVWPACTRGTVPPPPPNGTPCSRPRPEIVVKTPVDDDIAVSPEALRFEGVVRERSFGIRTRLPAGVGWQANVSHAWIGLSASFGRAAPTSVVEVRVKPAGLSPGIHTGQVMITFPGTTYVSRFVDVTLVVSAAPPPLRRTGRCGAGKEVASGSFTGVGAQKRSFGAGRMITVHVRNTGQFRARVRISAISPTSGSLENELAPGERLLMPFSTSGSGSIDWTVEVANLAGGATLEWFVCSEREPGDPLESTPPARRRPAPRPPAFRRGIR